MPRGGSTFSAQTVSARTANGYCRRMSRSRSRPLRDRPEGRVGPSHPDPPSCSTSAWAVRHGWLRPLLQPLQYHARVVFLVSLSLTSAGVRGSVVW
jgi:hypothetical protein